MRQGDSYPILISDTGVTLSDVSKIEFVIGPYTKEYPGTVTYDATNKQFSFPISQEESMKLIGDQPCQARIKYTSGKVEGMVIGGFSVDPALSKAVI